MTVVSVRNGGAGSAANVRFQYEVLLGGNVLRRGDRSSTLLAPGDHLTDRPLISSAEAGAFLMNPKSFVVKAIVEYDTGVGGRTDTCAMFTYDPAARVFSPDSGCDSIKGR
jgi:hypothetical protein